MGNVESPTSRAGNTRVLLLVHSCNLFDLQVAGGKGSFRNFNCEIEMSYKLSARCGRQDGAPNNFSPSRFDG